MATVPTTSIPKAPTGKAATATPVNPLAQYLSPASATPKPGAPNTNVGSGSYPDLMLAATTGGAITDSNKFTQDVNAATRALAMQHAAGALPVGASGSGGSDPYSLALQQAIGGYNTGRGDILNQSNRADSDLAQIFARTQNAQRVLQSHAIQGFHANNARIGSTYDDLLGRIGSNYGAGGASLAHELQRLGLQAASPGASQGLIRDDNFATDRASADKANALTNNNAVSSLIANLMSDLRGSTAAAGASARASNKQQTQDALNKLAQQLATQKSSIAMGRASGSGVNGKQTPQEKAAAYAQYHDALAALGYGPKKGKVDTIGKGDSAALQYILNYSGNDKAKALELQNEYKFLQTIPGGLNAQLAHLYGHDPKTGKAATSGLGRWQKQGLPYGQADADAVAHAIKILLGKG